ncbi:MAG: ammonia-forming cytochrome c nitrite reductase subunit c552 [Leptospiraceae bacterium]|nr:ammonia-forming cytochrome c nitrite reductase subunit c552 [Leptospiraceae bacterium]
MNLIHFIFEKLNLFLSKVYQLKLSLAFFSLCLISIFLLASDTSFFSFGFSRGEKPVSTLSSSKLLSSKSCKSCHNETHYDWEHSRHKVSWTNPIFQDGFSVEKIITCIDCHSPLKEQVSSILKNENTTNPLVQEGVNCATCHLRENSILSNNPLLFSNPNHKIPHKLTYSRELGSSEFCAGCHEFQFHKVQNGKLVLLEEKMQTTYSEWKEFISKTESQETCQSCHMPDRKHSFQGAHDQNRVKQSVGLKLSRTKDQVQFQIFSIGIGHNFPTGDLFRNITLEVKEEGSNHFNTIYVIGREFELYKNPKTNEVEKRKSLDSSLKPNEIVNILFTSSKNFEYRLIYHYTSKHDEERKKLPENESKFEILSGHSKS